eukprot:jgi/Botrbrau1/9861/Bobra.0313s0030.1
MPLRGLQKRHTNSTKGDESKQESPKLEATRPIRGT